MSLAARIARLERAQAARKRPLEVWRSANDAERFTCTAHPGVVLSEAEVSARAREAGVDVVRVVRANVAQARNA